ncbi:hypothetical protein LguiA_019500 [Lonicera macranthoides]
MAKFLWWCLSFSPRSSRPKATDPEGSEAFVHVSSEWGVVQGLGSPSRSFGDSPHDGHFSGEQHFESLTRTPHTNHIDSLKRTTPGDTLAG